MSVIINLLLMVIGQPSSYSPWTEQEKFSFLPADIYFVSAKERFFFTSSKLVVCLLHSFFATMTETHTGCPRRGCQC